MLALYPFGNHAGLKLGCGCVNGQSKLTGWGVGVEPVSGS